MLPNPVDLLSRLLNLPQQMAGAFGVIPGLRQASSGLGFQSITVGAQTFESARVTWSGNIRNTGNSPLAGIRVHLRTVQVSTPFRETNVALETISPGAAAPVSLVLDVSSSDPPGSFFGHLQVEQAGTVLGQVISPILGTINPLATPTLAPTPTPTPTLVAIPKFAVGDRVRVTYQYSWGLPATILQVQIGSGPIGGAAPGEVIYQIVYDGIPESRDVVQEIYLERIV